MIDAGVPCYVRYTVLWCIISVLRLDCVGVCGSVKPYAHEQQVEAIAARNCCDAACLVALMLTLTPKWRQ